MIIFNKNALKNKIQHYKVSVKDTWLKLRSNKEDVKIQNKKADEAGLESFPASDPPGHMSTSQLDKESHL